MNQCVGAKKQAADLQWRPANAPGSEESDTCHRMRLFLSNIAESATPGLKKLQRESRPFNGAASTLRTGRQPNFPAIFHQLLWTSVHSRTTAVSVWAADTISVTPVPGQRPQQSGKHSSFLLEIWPRCPDRIIGHGGRLWTADKSAFMRTYSEVAPIACSAMSAFCGLTATPAELTMVARTDAALTSLATTIKGHS